MSTQIQVSPKSGLTIGTTAITLGVAGRVLFEGAGNVVQEDAGLTFNNGAFAVKTGASTRLSIGNDPVYKVFNLCDSVYNDGFSTYLKTPAGATPQVTCSGNGLVLTSSFVTSLSASNQIQITTNSIVRSYFDNAGFVGIGPKVSGLGARLDVQAQGALSTDIAFRVRNSADSANFVSVQGDGSSAFGTYTNPNTRLTVTGTTFGAYISGNTGIYAQSNITSGTLYAIDCLGRALSGANTSFGIRATSDTSGVGSTNFGGRFNAYNGATNYAGYFDATGGTNNYGIYIQRGDMVFGVSPTLNKIGFWNATPIVQPTTAIASAALVSNAGTNLTNTDTFDGYTMQQVVKALRNLGVLA